MKPILLLAVAMFSLSACKNSTKTTQQVNTSDTGASSKIVVASSEKVTESAFSKVVANYLRIKNALADDNATEAARAGGDMVNALTNVKESTLTTAEKKAYENVYADLKENAEHISLNGNKIAHQREHFDLLSQDLYGLIKTNSTHQKLYKDYCPMYDDEKGAFWISEIKDIKNPYLGKRMPDCGEVKEEINN